MTQTVWDDSIQETTTTHPVSLCASYVTVPLSLDRLAALEATFQSTPDPVAVLARDGSVVVANRSALAFAGWTADEASGRVLWHAPGWQAFPTLSAWLEASVLQAREGVTTTHAETVAIDGQPRTLQYAVRMLPGARPDEPLWQLVALDVSERELVKSQLLQRERRLRLLTDNMHDLLLLVRVDAAEDYRVESVNQAWLTATGMTEQQVIDRPLDEVLGADAAAPARVAFAKALASAQPAVSRDLMAAPNGRLTLETTVSAIRDDRGVATHLLMLSRDVSGEERSLAALRQSEARFRAALDAGTDAFVIATAVRDEAGAVADLLVVEANERAASLVGATVQDLMGRSLLEAFPLSRDTGLWEQCCEVLATQRPIDMAQPAPVPHDSRRWVQRQILPLGDSVAISSRNVTSREMQREALEASEARHRQLFESSAAIQLIVDVETGALLDVNPAAEVFYGWPGESMRSMLITDIDHVTLDAWRADWPHDATGRAGVVVHAHRVAGQQTRQVEIASSRIVYDGRIVRHLIVHDVSDRLRAEARLRESEARFRSVINGMSEGVVIHDATGTIRAFNPSAERILGLSAAELRGLQPVAIDWKALHEDGSEWPTSQHPAMVALRTGRSQPRTLMSIRRGDADHVWIQVSADPLIHPGEPLPYAAVAVFTDVTVQRGAEVRLRQAQKLEAVGQLAGGIAHDFNNLLTVIRGAAGFLRDGVESDSPLLEDVQAIERATERAEELTRRLLSIGRRQLLRSEHVDLRALLLEQFPIIREGTAREVRLKLDLDESPIYAQVDREQLLDALRTLVDNARAAMVSGGELTIIGGVRVVARPVADNGETEARSYAMLEVRDTGQGMSADVRARLFEPFFSTQPFGTGRGMGLAAVHGMVTQSHGFIECDSSPGVGTSVRLYFPVVAAPERSTTPASPVATIEARGVLLVDDDPMLRDLARRMLERLGHRVAVVGSGAEALDVLSREASNVSIVVTDLTMPGMGGMELIEALQARYPSLPIVAISGFTMQGTAREQLAARRVGFLAKPFHMRELASAIERASAAVAR